MTPRTGTDLYLAYRLDGPTNHFTGLLDEVTFYDRDLTGSKIKSIYAAGPSGKCGVDSNANGIPDLWEMTYFGNLNQTAGGDYDGDGLTNLQEYQMGLNPTSQDSDGDNVIDQVFKVTINRPRSGSGLP